MRKGYIEEDIQVHSRSKEEVEGEETYKLV